MLSACSGGRQVPLWLLPPPGNRAPCTPAVGTQAQEHVETWIIALNARRRPLHSILGRLTWPGFSLGRPSASFSPFLWGPLGGDPHPLKGGPEHSADWRPHFQLELAAAGKLDGAAASSRSPHMSSGPCPRPALPTALSHPALPPGAEPAGETCRGSRDAASSWGAA